MQSMAAGAVRSTVGGLLTDDVVNEVRTQTAATPYLRDLTFRQG
jgi:hypothetical protein